MTLRSYLKDTNTRQEDFAAEIGVTQATISRLVRGVATPSIELAAQIKRATNGAVDFETWVSMPQMAVSANNPNQECSHDNPTEDRV